MSVSDRARTMKIKPTQALWEGPSGKGPQGGVTFSLLNRFLTCRDRFKALVVNGLKPREEFNHRIEVGNMFHLLEEARHSEVRHFGEVVGTTLGEDNLEEYTENLCKKYPFQQQEIVKWYGIVKTMYPIYVEHWAKNPDVTNRTSVFAEQVFDVPYTLPDGRTVRLRGKWDDVGLIQEGREKKLWINDNKTKSKIDTEGIERQLKFDLQMMMYSVALRRYLDYYQSPTGTIFFNGFGEAVPAVIGGIYYNVVKRPAQYQGKKETVQEFHERLAGIIREKPKEFFHRWKADITQRDLDIFRGTCLDPLLMQLCLWYDVAVAKKKVSIREVPLELVHFTAPYGCYNILTEGGIGDTDNFIFTGSEVGLRKVTSLFTELEV